MPATLGKQAGGQAHAGHSRQAGGHRIARAAAKARGMKLGGLQAGSQAPTAEHVAMSVVARQKKAGERAEAVAPIIADIRAAGVTSLRGIAAELMARGIPAARGGAVWTAAGVSRVIAAA